VDKEGAVGLEDEKPNGFGEPSGQAAGVLNLAAGDDKAHARGPYCPFRTVVSEGEAWAVTRHEILRRSRMSTLTRITDHVYWMPPGPPDRPSLCAVVGDLRTVMLDAGSSAAHARTFLGALLAVSGTRPTAVVYTHSHWDHVLGGAEVDGMVIAHALTAERLIDLAERDWSDQGLERRVAAGLSSPQHAADVKAEMPSPRKVEVAPADIVFHDRIEIDLGGVTVHVRHVGGDHSADACVMYVEPDRVLFLGDYFSASPEGVMSSESASELRDVILGSPAEHYIEGHHESVSSRSEIEALLEKMELAERAVRDGMAIEASDEDTRYFVDAFRAGQSATS
jgi:glyoxylase-like metal-dependent hydrolase (beta-lactamase superfamily II)